MLINWILEGLELHLEGIWDALGRSWASSWHSWTPLGCFLDVQNPIFFRHWPKIGSKRASESILGRFGKGLGKIFGAFGMVWWRLSFIFGCLWEGLSKRLLKWFGVDFNKSKQKGWSDLGLTSNRWQGAGGVSAKRSQFFEWSWEWCPVHIVIDLGGPGFIRITHQYRVRTYVHT